jgi:hypothetical protein
MDGPALPPQIVAEEPVVRISAAAIAVLRRSDAMGADQSRRFARHSTPRLSHPLKALYMLRDCAETGSDMFAENTDVECADE